MKINKNNNNSSFEFEAQVNIEGIWMQKKNLFCYFLNFLKMTINKRRKYQKKVIYVAKIYLYYTIVIFITLAFI